MAMGQLEIWGGVAIMKNPNGYGTIKKLNGARRRPYGAYITTDYDMPEAWPDISFLADALPPDLFRDVQQRYESYKLANIQPAKQVQKCIGTFENKRDAMLALADYNRAPYDMANSEITFSEVYNILYEREFKELKTSMRQVYTTSFKKCEILHNMKMREIKLAHLQGVMDNYAEYSNSVQTNLKILFHAIFNYAIENDIIARDYSKFVKISPTPEKKRKPFSKNEIRTIQENLDWSSPAGVQMMDIVLTMIYTGMRIGEILAVRCEDVHLADRWMAVHGTKTAAADRIVPIHRDIIPIIQARLAVGGELLFERDGGGKIGYQYFTLYFFNDFKKHFGIDKTPHACRHTFITLAMASDMNQVLIRKMVGHSASNVTEVTYTHAYISDLVREIDKLKI